MTRYRVQIRNDLTGQQRRVTLQAENKHEAQANALHWLFRQYGWRCATAQKAVEL